MEIKVEIPNLSQFVDAVRQSPRIVGRRLGEAIMRAGLQFEADTKNVIVSGTGMYRRPFQTGNLWRSIHAEWNQLTSTITANVDYAIYVHEGTYKMQARPFFDITSDLYRDKTEAIFKEQLNLAMDEIAQAAK